MSLRDALGDLLTCDRPTFADSVEPVAAEYGFEHGRLDSTDQTLPVGTMSDHERDLVWRARVLDDAPMGITVSGPAYQDNPIIYANRHFRAMTGYDLDALVGENPRLLQGPDSEGDAVGDLREATRIWEPVTVELWNYRADGARFRNRVSLVPTEDETGTVTNWVGLQQRVDG